MGGMQGMLGMIPGLGKISKQLEKANLDDKILSRQIALITSMTKRERSNPQILQASRKKRIAMGAGQEVSDLNKLIKMHRQMADVMKKIGRKGNRGMLRDLIGNLTGSSGSKKKLTDLVDQNAALRNPLQTNLGSKDLTRMMGGIPDFKKKN